VLRSSGVPRTCQIQCTGCDYINIIQYLTYTAPVLLLGSRIIERQVAMCCGVTAAGVGRPLFLEWVGSAVESF